MAAAELFISLQRATTARPHPRAEALRALARRFHDLELTPSYGPGDHGNMSCRLPGGCLITARESSKAALQPDQLIAVVGMRATERGWEVDYEGAWKPSTDALLHLRLYTARPDVAAILHGHDREALAAAARLGAPMTERSAKTPTLELIEELLQLCAAHGYVLMRDHGFLALGASLEEAEALVMAWYRRARTTGAHPGQAR